jgi:ribonuclease P protein component
MRRRDEFASTIRTGRRGSSAAVVVHTTRSAPQAAVGFIVSRSVGGAVVRNRVRRRLRHLVAARLPELPRDAALVVRALPAAAAASPAQLGADLDRALQRSGLEELR